MKSVLSATCVAVACAVTLSAQAPPTGTSKPQSPTTQPAQKSTQADDKSVMVKGCLRAGDQPGTFVLANASVDQKGAATTGTTGTALKDKTVRLVGTPAGVNLKEHVGHIVEASGMLMEGESKAPSTADKPAAGKTAAADMPRLNVKAVKHVKEGC